MSRSQSNVHLIFANLRPWVGPELGEDVVAAAREAIATHPGRGRLRGALIRAFGEDLHIHLTSFNGDFANGESPAELALALARQAIVAAASAAVDHGAGAPARPHELGATELDAAVELRRLHLPYTERGSEPILVAKALNASWGFFNRALFNLYFNPDKGSGHRIEGNDFLARVESIADLREGASRVRSFDFGPGDGNEMLALVSDPDEWRLSEVLAVRGRFGGGPYRDEPAARVAGGCNPALVARAQAGLPAVGEILQAVGEFYFGPGGREGGYRVGLLPTTFEEARSSTAADGVARVVAYAYQSYDHGRIPEDDDLVDLFAQNPAETRNLQRAAMETIRHMTTHGEFEPYISPERALGRAERAAETLVARFRPIPTGSDPVVVAANRAAAFTVSDIKADAGGRVGHTSCPRHFTPTARASLDEAEEQGLILPGSTFLVVGDDGHLLMTHRQGADDNEIHLLAFRTFFRQIWVAEALGYSWYGLGQDLVGEASAGRTTAEQAALSDRFIAGLRRHLDAPEQRRFTELETAYRNWRHGVSARPAVPPFAGNVSGEGPGFAELPMPRAGRIGLLAMDKAGPAAFNLPVWEALRRCRADGSLARHLAATGSLGVVLEVWDVERHRRIFLDEGSEAEAAARLLGATDKFNFKRVWSRNGEWRPSEPEAGLGEVLLAASTERLALITGGEYRGKDDPVLLAVEPLANALNLFMRDRFYMTQGDGRGSHNMFPTPLALPEAVATLSSRAVSVSLMLSFDASGRLRHLRDVFAGPEYDEARARAFRLNKAIWDGNGSNFAPVGVGASKVEGSYPLARMIRRITAEGSPYETRRREAPETEPS